MVACSCSLTWRNPTFSSKTFMMNIFRSKFLISRCEELFKLTILNQLVSFKIRSQTLLNLFHSISLYDSYLKKHPSYNSGWKFNWQPLSISRNKNWIFFLKPSGVTNSDFTLCPNLNFPVFHQVSSYLIHTWQEFQCSLSISLNSKGVRFERQERGREYRTTWAISGLVGDSRLNVSDDWEEGGVKELDRRLLETFRYSGQIQGKSGRLVGCGRHLVGDTSRSGPDGGSI